jgi:tRNA pseudouridine55 synthase
MISGDQFKDGQVLLIDKPLNWTSFQVVNKLRWEIRNRFNFKKIKVGHAGTLDPLATGLLVVCTGKMTKSITDFQGQEKEYTGIIRLGSTTPSYDLETEIDQKFPTEHLNHEMIYDAVNTFNGEIEQYPPIFSALKKEGKRLYEFARSGESVDIKPRKVSITEFEITNINNLDVSFRIKCSKGTYIRSIANDFGKILNSGGHLINLRRTKIGVFDVTNALSPIEFIDTLKSE